MRCPECGKRMRYSPAEPDVGIPTAGYECTNDECNKVIDEMEFDDYDPEL